MASRGIQIPKSLGSCLGFPIMGAVILVAGSRAAFAVGGLILLGGVASLGDRRRNPFTGFGMVTFGEALIIGRLFLTVSNKPMYSQATPPSADQSTVANSSNAIETHKPEGVMSSSEPTVTAKSSDNQASDIQDQQRSAAEDEERKKALEAESRDVAAKMADQYLRLGKAVEKVNPRAALEYYRKIIQQYPELPQAKIAADKVKLIEKLPE